MLIVVGLDKILIRKIIGLDMHENIDECEFLEEVNNFISADLKPISKIYCNQYTFLEKGEQQCKVKWFQEEGKKKLPLQSRSRMFMRHIRSLIIIRAVAGRPFYSLPLMYLCVH